MKMYNCFPQSLILLLLIQPNITNVSSGEFARGAFCSTMQIVSNDVKNKIAPSTNSSKILSKPVTCYTLNHSPIIRKSIFFTSHVALLSSPYLSSLTTKIMWETSSLQGLDHQSFSNIIETCLTIVPWCSICSLKYIQLGHMNL